MMRALHVTVRALLTLLFLALFPQICNALTSKELYDGVILFMYGGIGFFGAIAMCYFFGGFVVYLARLGQEYRQVGLYHMLHGVRILFYILLAAVVLRLLE